MNNGIVFMDMNVQTHPTGSQHYYLMKKWSKYIIYTKTGSWTKNYPSKIDNSPQSNSFGYPISQSWNKMTYDNTANLYSSNSVYLYNYVLVTDTFYNLMVYTASISDPTPGNPGSEDYDQVTGQLDGWIHLQNTFRNTPNAIVNNYRIPVTILQIGPSQQVQYGTPYVINDGEDYFEIVNGYPRNHWIHKRGIFSLYTEHTINGKFGNTLTSIYHRSEQTINSTIGQSGLEDGSLPIQSATVGNAVPIVQSSNVINQ